MKFAHLSDTHLGSWKDELMNELCLKTFENVMNNIIKEKVDFILISGDIFDTSYPKIDILKKTAGIMKKVKDNDIPIYVIAGSHDYSPTDKTILKVFESAGLMINVFKASYSKNNKINLDFTIDKSGAKITGIIGRIIGTDLILFQEMNREKLEKEDGFKIFLFHNTITEDKDDEISFYDSISSSFLPKNFNYYAGGHIHKVLPRELLNKEIKASRPIIYPGCLFPTDFLELESNEYGGYCIVTNDNGKINIKLKEEKIFDILPLYMNVDKKDLEEVNDSLLELINENDVDEKIITLRIEGKMISGNPSDIDFGQIEKKLMKRKCLKFFRNTRKFTSIENVLIKPMKGKSKKEIEDKIIKENLGKIKVKKWDKKKEEIITKNLIEKCSYKRGEQKVSDFTEEKTNLFLEILEIKDIRDKYM